MAQCEYCDKKPAMGNQVETRGKAKYLGGVGTKVTGISRREFKPNLQRVRITTPNGTNRYARVCTRCLKKGVIRKAIQQAPFKLPVNVQKPPVAAKGAAPAAKTATPAKAAAPAKGTAKATPTKAAPTKNGPPKGK
jgi:large subunit ribosomal protein L28